MCDIQRTAKSNLPTATYYTYSEDSNSVSLETWAGVSTLGIGLFNGLDATNMDAAQSEAMTMDLCMQHAAPTTNALHAHTISPCAPADGKTTTATTA